MKTVSHSISQRSPAKPARTTIAFRLGLGAERCPGHDESDSDRRCRLEAEQRRLRVWAREARRLKPRFPGEDARPGETRAVMEARGFERIGSGTFYHRGFGVLVDDLFARNVKVSGHGGVLPIDLVFQRVTPEFAEFLREHHDPIPEDEADGPAQPVIECGKGEDAAPVRRRLTGLKLELEEAEVKRLGMAVDADLLRERFRQPRVSRREALRQIADTLLLSESARAELDRTMTEDCIRPNS